MHFNRLKVQMIKEHRAKKSRGSWVESANVEGCDFPIENLPFGKYYLAADAFKAGRVGIAIGDQILDLISLATCTNTPSEFESAFALLVQGDMNAWMATSDSVQTQFRSWITYLLEKENTSHKQLASALLPQSSVVMNLPCKVGDYTDFYSGIHHATNVGKMLRPDAPLSPNYHWLPVGYHGRSSSLIPSGVPVIRPRGQTRASDGKPPYFQASRRLDYELELGVLIGKGNQLGTPISITQAEEYFFGMCILNDWSARDMQAWEAAPLGPFLAKSFATSISPWIITKAALAPFRKALQRSDPTQATLPYLDCVNNQASGAIQIYLEVLLQTQEMRTAGLAPYLLAQSEYSGAAYWTIAQLIAHHTSNGCNLTAGDLFGTGTLSGSTPESAGSLLELSQGGKAPISLPSGQTRTFLEDGDTVIMNAFCAHENAVRIGFGQCINTVVASH
jgi:fumarylacetoacetase